MTEGPSLLFFFSKEDIVVFLISNQFVAKELTDE